MKLQKMHWAGIVASVVLIGFAGGFFYDNQKMLLFLVGIGIGIGALPFVISTIFEGKKEEKIDEMFLEFTRNLAESVSTGTPISKSIVNIKKKNYGVLNPHIAKLVNQIELGIPIERALNTFANDIGSPVVKRAVGLIREAGRAGGEIDYILESTSKSISEVEKLKKERKAAVYSLVVQGYIIFFIFIGIVLVMQYKILPLASGLGGISMNADSLSNVNENAETLNTDDFSQPFVYLLLTQGFFAGLTIGKLTEGSIKRGIKHSFVLMIVAFLISTGSQIFMPIAAA